MSGSHGTFATALNCMDGRTQEIVVKKIKEFAGVDYVDMITEPGVDGILAKNENLSLLEWVLTKVKISTEKHGSKYVAVVGHGDHCAGNPVDKDQHFKDIATSVGLVRSWVGPDVKVVGLYTESDPTNVQGEWKVELVC